MPYNVNNEVLCDFDCLNCVIVSSCTDSIIEKEKKTNE